MRKILIVDDSSMIISLLEKELYKSIPEIEVVTAKNYKEGVKHILQHGDKIAIAILDLHLPGAKNGAMIDIVESHSIKSIVLSGFLDEEAKRTIFDKNSVVDCIAKDGKKSIKNVVNTIKKVLKNETRNILLVDDSKAQMQVAQRILRKMNLLNIYTAVDGKEAYEIIQNSNEKFSLVLTDYNMPNMDGMELTFKIREEYDKDELAIIVLSSNDNPDTASNFLKIGANDFINKPYLETEFVTRVNSNLDLIELFEKTKEMANRDFLTGAYNRRYFFEAGNNLLLKAQRKNHDIAIAMLDIDKFKSINDTYGHEVGDIAICEVVNILNKNLRESDLMARFGGEEFCIMIEDITKEDAMALFEKIRDAFEQNIIETPDTGIKFTTSIGVAFGITNNLDDMINVADKALYYCKENGRNQVYLGN